MLLCVNCRYEFKFGDEFHEMDHQRVKFLKEDRTILELVDKYEKSTYLCEDCYKLKQDIEFYGAEQVFYMRNNKNG